MTISSRQAKCRRSDMDVERALATIRLHQDAIRHADAKISRLFAFHGSVVALLVSKAPVVFHGIAGSSVLSMVVHGVALLFVITLLIAARHLAIGFRPQTSGPRSPNRFGFPTLRAARIAPPRLNAAREATEAWFLVKVLANVALEKHRRVQAAMPWSAAASCAATVWLALGMLIA
ncbi:hypothetical protein [Micromonospora sp. WMMC250]|uniref:hypothetical protein n=1 Tax=Micromonospora sp. WMMC250 TaxID=3014781 RepID=UPI0022B64871|nr:hypothetical protein [Micromonospora sp. WMMC250]MCZ7374622.1 hypothetical protein [Micromonospora sp. WMMC250]